MDVKGIAAIVTGGASGLGEGTARALAKAGAKVTVIDLKAEAAQQVASEIGGLGIGCDITEAAATEAAFAQARDKHGPARILINCAGVATGARIISREGPASLEGFARTVSINLVGTFNTMRLAAWDMSTLEPLADNERGVIVNTTSIAAFEGQIGQCAYSSSKSGVAALTLPAARELSKFGVRVLCIAPGLFATPMMFGLPQEVQDSLGSKTPFPQRLGRPQEFASLVMAMLDNVMLNGEVVRLDGAVRLEPK
ncbi:MAG: SDR family NAD(P)-dependent oxidoreductase [Alphaproteobacteria bacterium]|nr:SDR family NAD(P)-dependent oxidoreductase [Alphaproteobacteria bacterium]